MKIEIEESDRQLTLMALSELALSKPGFDDALGRIAENLGGKEMFEGFKKYRSAVFQVPAAGQQMLTEKSSGVDAALSNQQPDANERRREALECEMGTVREALECAEYALSHPQSDQAFALDAVRDVLGAMNDYLPVRCVGYPDCDGNLEGEQHSDKCPLHSVQHDSVEMTQ